MDYQNILFRGKWYTLYVWRWNATAGAWLPCAMHALYPTDRMIDEWRYDHAVLTKRKTSHYRFINAMRYW